MQNTLLVPFLNRAADAFDPAAWFQLVPKGTFPISRKEGDKTRVYQQVVDDVACQKIVSAFQNRQAAAPAFKLLIGFEHFAHQPNGSSEAACWVSQVEKRADGVWAKGEWTPDGQAAIANRKYRFLSPVWFPRQTEPIAGNRFRPIEVNDAGLTNMPNLGDALQPFWNRAEDFPGREAISQKTTENKAMKDRLIALFKMPAASTEDEIFAQATAFLNRASQADTLQGSIATLTADHTALKNRHTALLTVSVTDTLEEFSGLIAPTAIDAWKNRLTADFEGTRALLTGLKPTAATGNAKKIADTLNEFAGVITAESTDAWKNRLTADFDGTVALLKGIKKPDKKTPVHGEGHGGKGRSDVTETEEAHPFMNRVTELRAADGKLSETAAILKAAGENPALYDEYSASLHGAAE